MQNKKVIVGNALQEPILEKLREKVNVIHIPDANLSDETFLQHIKDANGLIGFYNYIHPHIIEQAEQLKIISNVSVGYNNLPIDVLTEHNIMATNTPDVLTDTVADVIFGLLIATARQIPRVDRFVKNKQWNGLLPLELHGVDVHHKTIGIIGMGRIGAAIAKRAHFGFDMDVLYYNRSQNKEAEETYNADYVSLTELLHKSDFVVLMTPLTKETERLIGKEQFKQMKDSAIFINGSRGGTVVESDLIDALTNGVIAAAGLDVFEQEPIQDDNPLLTMENVVTLPHIGSSTIETETKMSELAMKNLLQGLRREKPISLINESVWTGN